MRICQERLLQVLVAPHVSEKATNIADQNKQFTFKVMPCATKKEVQLAVEKVFNVKVKAVNLLNMKGKKKRTGKFAGRRRDWKKAYVSLYPGHDIAFSEMVPSV